jgi:pantoate kinase
MNRDSFIEAAERFAAEKGLNEEQAAKMMEAALMALLEWKQQQSANLQQADLLKRLDELMKEVHDLRSEVQQLRSKEQ